MYISVQSILGNPLFKEKEILAGEGGLNRSVKRVTVFEHHYGSADKIGQYIDKGDLLITGLAPFLKEKKDRERLVLRIIERDVAGIIVITDEFTHLMSEQVLDLLDEKKVPVVLLREDIPFGDLLREINNYTAVYSLNMSRKTILDAILYDNLKEYQQLEKIKGLSSFLQKKLQVVSMKGSISSDISYGELHVLYLNSKHDVYIDCGENHLFIVSGDNEEVIKKNVKVTLQKMKNFFETEKIGISQIHKIGELKEALVESKTALNICTHLEGEVGVYDPTSMTTVLFSLSGSPTLEEYYDSCLKRIKLNTTEEGYKELLHTMVCYVNHGGGYLNVAKEMGQHENTIRYRMNKLKQIFNMEEDPIAFYETISILSKLQRMHELE